MKHKIIVFALTVISVIILSSSTTIAYAGVSRQGIADNKTIDNGWTSVGNDKSYNYNTDKQIIFNSQTSNGLTLVTNAQITKPTIGSPKFIEVDSLLNIIGFTGNSYFAFAFGMPNKKTNIGYGTYLELYMQQGGNSDGVSIGIRYINNGVKQSPLVECDNAFNKESDKRICAVINTDKVDGGNKELIVFVNGEEKLKTDLSVNYFIDYENYPQGRFAFGQNGQTSLTIKSISVDTYTYDTPENYTYLETFDAVDHSDSKGGYNSNVWYSKATLGQITPSYLGVDTDESGNSYLRFNNTGRNDWQAFSYICTKEKYSNCEITFDLFDVRNKCKDEDGNFIGYICGQFSFYFGVVNEYNSIAVNQVASEFSCLLGWIGGENPVFTDEYIYGVKDNSGEYIAGKIPHYRNLVIWRQGVPYYPNSAREAVIDGNKNLTSDMYCDPFKLTESGLSGKMKVKLSINDGLFKMYVINYEDYENDSSYEQGLAIFYNMGFTPLGRFVMTQNSGNCSIDNLCIKNTDYESVKREKQVTYLSNRWNLDRDIEYDYNSIYDREDLLSDKLYNQESSDILVKDLIIVCVSSVVAAVSVVVLVLYIIIVNRKRNNENKN